MIVVTSNWAVGDGTLVPAAAAWHGTLPAAIHRAAIRAGIRSDGSYRPIERLDLVMAGDTFDWLLSAEWQSAVKPWHGTVAARQAVARVARRSIGAARRLLGPVIHWARQGLPVPAAAGSRPGRVELRIPARVTLLAGDRDAAVEECMGGRRDRQPVTVGSRWDDGRLAIRHGHDLDPACRVGGDRRGARERSPTLAESVAVDLVGRFATAARPVASGIGRFVRSLAAAGPLGIPAVLSAHIGGASGGTGGDRSAVVDAWRRCVDAWWHEARRLVPDCEVEFDAVDAIAGWFAGGCTEWSCVPQGLERLRPQPPRGSPGLVLGHVSAAAGNSAVVCLGPGAETMETRGPTVIACPDVGGWPRWRSILPTVESPAVVAIRAEEPPAAHGGRIVDAA
jgi:hypothetical protein